MKDLDKRLVKDLTSKLFLGYIVPGKPPQKPLDHKNLTGRYLVNIPEIMSHLDDNEGVWCYNDLCTLRINTFLEKYPNGPIGHSKKNPILEESGTYNSLLTGAKYYIKFTSNDINTGHIVVPATYDMDYKLNIQVKELMDHPIEEKKQQILGSAGDSSWSGQ